MNRLLEIGFECAGHWVLQDERLCVEFKRLERARNVLYAFVVDGEVKYLGKSTRTLRERMGNYISPGAKKRQTNHKNNRNIRELLTAGAAVDIYVLPDNGLMHYGPYHLNLAAGLEDSLLNALKPEWNGKDKRLIVGAVDDEVEEADAVVEAEPMRADEDAQDAVITEAPVLATFDFQLQPTYRTNGFFNGGVTSSAYLGAHGETIQIFFGNEPHAILGTINRTSNSNGSPRLFGGPELRERFQTLPEKADMRMEVFSPTAVRVHPMTWNVATSVRGSM